MGCRAVSVRLGPHEALAQQLGFLHEATAGHETHGANSSLWSQGFCSNGKVQGELAHV